MMEQIIEWILLAHAAFTFIMVGLIWFVQIVHYPLLASIDESSFSSYEKRHVARTPFVVLPPMIGEAVTTLLLICFRPLNLSMAVLWSGVLLLVIIWLSTFFLQMPYHEKLARGFDSATHRSLVLTNWIRTLAWSLRGILALWMIQAT
ncbi:hypothetical protein SH501x_000704 [Pirellulaceae bacterium SH501]